MTLPLTPEVIPAAYEFLRATRPFKAWRLPHADEIEFHATLSKSDFGEYTHLCRTEHRYILISSVHVRHTDTLIRVLAHEMIHLHQALRGTETAGSQHNAQFHRIAKRICDLHGFDVKAF